MEHPSKILEFKKLFGIIADFAKSNASRRKRWSDYSDFKVKERYFAY
ncbi:hypothetical protein A45J_1096 [hot springs metagenome]|uniref:Uncharacterized protein n=1 Tax=hot springs metagenome TaxID=433727 RepID=A0A5J4L3I1_9ZZZZ